MAGATKKITMPAMVGLALVFAGISAPATARAQTAKTPQEQLHLMIFSALMTYAGTYVDAPTFKGAPKTDFCEIVREAARELIDAESFGMRAQLSEADRKSNADDMDRLWKDIASASKEQNCGAYVPGSRG